MRSAFADVNTLIINTTDVPDFSQVKDMSNMFFNIMTLNGDLNTWDVSNVTSCIGFAENSSLTTSYTPNFTNCTP